MAQDAQRDPSAASTGEATEATLAALNAKLAAQADGATNTSNPVLVGGEAQDPTALPAATTAGKIVRFLTDLSRRMIVTLGTAIAGEDIAKDVLKVEQRFTGSAVVAADTLVLTGSGYVDSVTFSCNDAAPTAGSIIIYDNTAESGTVIFNHTFTTTPFMPFTVQLHRTVGTGIYIGFTTTNDVNVVLAYRA